MSLRTLLYSLQIDYGPKTYYNLIILVTISIFMFSMVNYQSISAVSTNTKTPNDKTSNTKTPNDKTSNTKTPNDKTSNTKTPNDKTSNTKTPNLQDPILVPFNSNYVDTLD